ncbi:hypothetical protein NPIL_343321 [Nephila pilipes]|uniref:Uncharacterized protein n=1 Tax=Nephila pilipes TaxID=299642 RepID=A0A8X6NGV1_NEPPI|nr:hypothetical protein NPIL_343321 [Nephila pilipes]
MEAFHFPSEEKLPSHLAGKVVTAVFWGTKSAIVLDFVSIKGPKKWYAIATLSPNSSPPFDERDKRFSVKSAVLLDNKHKSTQSKAHIRSDALLQMGRSLSLQSSRSYPIGLHLFSASKTIKNRTLGTSLPKQCSCGTGCVTIP